MHYAISIQHEKCHFMKMFIIKIFTFVYQDWVALENTFSLNMTDLDSIVFLNILQPPFQDNYAYCKVYLCISCKKACHAEMEYMFVTLNHCSYYIQVQNFTRRFHEPPAVIVSAHREQHLSSALTDQNIVTWVKVIIVSDLGVVYMNPD